MDTMLAGRLSFSPRRFAVEEVPVPTPGRGEVLVEVGAAGVCHSDLSYIDGSFTPVYNRNPVVTLGHEVAGTLRALGPEVDPSWKPGMRVLLVAGHRCGRCANCRRGWEPCSLPAVRGADFDGGWAEYAVARQDTLVPIPDSLPFDQAAIIPDAVANPYAAVVKTGQVKPARSVGIWGVGGLGANGVRMARLAGAVPIVAFDPLPGARERALRFGADLALDPADERAVEVVRDATQARMLEVAFDFAGAPAVREQILSGFLGSFGVLVVVGITTKPLTVADSPGFVGQNLQIRGHDGYTGQDLDDLVRLASSGRLDLAPSVSGHVPLADAAKAVQQLRDKIGDPIRLVLVP